MLKRSGGSLVPSRACTFSCWEGAPGVWKIWPAKPVLPNTGNEKLVVRSGGPQTDSDGYLG